MINMLDKKRRKNISVMMSDLASLYFSAPASYKSEYNSCFPGGLSRHSLQVMKGMVGLTNGLKIRDCDKDSIIILSLFHDLGKIGDGVDSYYIGNDEYWKSRGYNYKINDKFNNIPPQTLSLFLLQKYGVELTYNEYLAIHNINDKRNSYDGNDVTYLLNCANIWSVIQENKETVNLTEEVNDKENEIELPQIIEESDSTPESKNGVPSAVTTMPDGMIDFDDAIKGLGIGGGKTQ